jgi:ribonuclease HI
MPYYAVAQGINPGVVTSWTECKANIDGFKGAVYKKFDTRAEAEAFVNTKAVKVPTKAKAVAAAIKAITEIQNSDFTTDYYVYTDGACSSNGSTNAEAGIGIYFGPTDPRNVSLRVQGKQTNNTAELGAIIHLHSIIKSDIQKGKKIAIVSDSEYAIRCVTSYGEKLCQSNWQKDVPNKEMVKQAYTLYKDHPNVKFVHVMAHTDGTDIHSLGNDGADKLANQAIGLEQCPYNDTRIFLQVPFAQKDIAKAMGARWEPSKKLWYTSQNNPSRKTLEELFTVSTAVQ